MNDHKIQIAKEIWKNYVPKNGPSHNLYGELLRQVEKLRDEAQRNGNKNFGTTHKKMLADLEKWFFDQNSCVIQYKEKIVSVLERLKKFKSPLTNDQEYDFLTECVVDLYANKSLGDGTYTVEPTVNFDHEGVVGVIGKEVEHPVKTALLDNNLLFIKDMISTGWDIEENLDEGSTALSLAACYGKQEIVEFLHANGADINSVDNYGNSVLDMAADKKSVYDFLKSKGAKSKRKKEF